MPDLSTTSPGSGPAAPGDGGAAADFRALMSHFPTGVSVVTSVGVDGMPRGLTCSSLISVTLDPPTLLVCLNTHSSTLQTLCVTGRFAVNLLHTQGRQAAELFAAPVADRFAWVTWAYSDAGMPRLVDDAFAFAECRVTGTQVIGDHAVVLGEVTSVMCTAGVPLLYGMRQFCGWPGSKSDQGG